MSAATPIDPNDPRLTAYALGELEGDALTAFEAELAADPGACAAVDAIRSLSVPLADVLAHAPDAGAPIVHDDVVAAGNSNDAPRVAAWRAQGLVAAASALLMVGTLAVVASTSSRQRRAPERLARVDTDAPALSSASARTAADPAAANKVAKVRDEREPGSTPFAEGGNSGFGSPDARTAPSRTESASPSSIVPSSAGGGGGHVGGGFVDVVQGDASSAASGPDAPPVITVGGSESTVDAIHVQQLKLRLDREARGPVDGRSIGIGGGGGGEFALGATGAGGGERIQCLSDDGIQPWGGGDRSISMPPDWRPRTNPAQNALLPTWSRHHTSTFSLDVDTASFARVRAAVTSGTLPHPSSIRIEELINAFAYDYPTPTEGQDMRITATLASCPWQASHRLARIALRARDVNPAARGPLNLVFLIDVSGSMGDGTKLPLAKQALDLMLSELRDDDHISIVTYANSAAVVLPATSVKDTFTIRRAIASLRAEGSTNGSGGIELAYAEAMKHAKKGTTSRVLLLTDGDFNVGKVDNDELAMMIAEKAKSGVYLSVYGFGMKQHDDTRLELLSNRGDGTYAFIDSIGEAKHHLVDQLTGSMLTVAKDAKIQVFFNPKQVRAWRLLGYANRTLAARDFNNDAVDAGDVGAGHTVTALYEIVPMAASMPQQAVDPNPFVDAPELGAPELGKTETVTASGEGAPTGEAIFRVRLRYKPVREEAATKSVLIEEDILDRGKALSDVDADFRRAAGVAAAGLWLAGGSMVDGVSPALVRELNHEPGVRGDRRWQTWRAMVPHMVALPR